MTPSYNKTTPSRKAGRRAARAAPPPPDHLRLGLLAAFAAVCVARPLVPSEAVSWLGDGHPFTMLLLVITGGYLLLALSRGRFARSFHWIDAIVAAFVLLMVASSVLGLLISAYKIGENTEFDARVASPRLAINMIWEWLGLGLVYFLARQLIVTSFESRALVTVMIGLAVVLSAFGLYQVFVTLPAEQAAYAKNPDEVLMRLGEWFPPGSPERARFEDRLNSTEPVATFALTNSLAGYLTPWLIVLVGVTWSFVQANRLQSGVERRGMQAGRMAGLAACLAIVLVCLVLTKSRSAYLALAVGFVLLPFSNEAFRRVINWRLFVVAALVLVLAVGLAVGTGRLDTEVLTEASKSLGYRLEYWQATIDMIANFPIFGVGPGEFQNYYTQFKLPQASEEIRDPHNFLLEVWATGGTLAFLLLVAVLTAFVWQSWELSEPAESPSESDPRDAGTATSALGFVSVGAAAGVLLAFAVGPPFGFYLPVGLVLAALAIGAAVLWLLWPWVSRGALPLRLPALGVLVLAVHLLAAGGFVFPGVAGSFWILMALGIRQGETAPRSEPSARPWWRAVPAVALGITILAAVVLYKSAFLPVLSSRAAMIRVLDERLNDNQRMEKLLEAANADPYSPEPPIAIAQLSVRYLKQHPKAEYWGLMFVDAASRLLHAQPHSSSAYRQVANWYREIYAVDPNADLADNVLEFTRGAAFLYPNSATVQADYALALAALDKMPAAKRAATKALELDELTPHADKKLSDDVKQQVQQLLEDVKSPPSEESKAAAEASSEESKPTGKP